MNTESNSNPIPRYYKWYMLIFLWFAFFLNQGDRQLFNNVQDMIEKPITDGGLAFSQIQLGMIGTIFNIFYGIFVPLAGVAGDKICKKTVVFLSLMIFSLGTLATGLVPNSEYLIQHLPGGLFYWISAPVLSLVLLILVRSIATGVGEAFYYPAANSLIDLYHKDTRATAMSFHQTANYTGVVFGGTLAAMIAKHFGWRTAFGTFGLIGIVWASIIFFLFRNDRKDAAYLRNGQQETNSLPKVSALEACKVVLSRPTFYFLSMAFACMCFVNVGYLTWMKIYLGERFGVDSTWASFNAVFYHHLTAYIAVIVAANLSDRLIGRIKNVRMHTEFWGLLLGTPFIYWMGAAESTLYVYIALACFGIFRGIYDSNLVASLFDVIEPKYRSTATGLMFAIAFGFGAFAAWILPIMKEYCFNNQFGPALSVLAVFYFVGAILVLLAMKLTYYPDREAAESNIK